MEHILSAVNVVLPVFAVIAVGYFMKRLRVIDESFVQKAMKVVFNVGLPGMLFTKISKLDVAGILSGDSAWYALFIFVGTLTIYFAARMIAMVILRDKMDRGTFVQGSIRSNYIIIGSSVLLSMFGDPVTFPMAVAMLIVIPMYNILTIWVFSEDTDKHIVDNLKEVSVKVAKNPLVIAIVLGFIAAVSNIPVPVVASSTISTLGSLGTPLGLLGIGAYMNFKELASIKTSLLGVALKLVIFPLLATVVSWLLGFSYMESAVIFVVFGSPAAISSFIMATALGGNSRMAANMVIIGTGSSMLTYIIGLSTLAFLYGGVIL